MRLLTLADVYCLNAFDKHTNKNIINASNKINYNLQVHINEYLGKLALSLLTPLGNIQSYLEQDLHQQVISVGVLLSLTQRSSHSQVILSFNLFCICHRCLQLPHRVLTGSSLASSHAELVIWVFVCRISNFVYSVFATDASNFRLKYLLDRHSHPATRNW